MTGTLTQQALSVAPRPTACLTPNPLCSRRGSRVVCEGGGHEGR